MNKKSAHFGSSLTLLIVFLAGCATGDFSRTRPVAPPAVYARDEVTYQNHWVNGINFVIATIGDMHVAAAMWRDKPRAFIILLNGSNDPVTFLPQAVVAEAIEIDSNRTQRYFLGTYSAKEYEKKMRTARGWGTALSILAAEEYPAISSMIQDKTRGTFQAMTTTLMRTHTLAPHTYYGGMIYFEKRKAKQYQLYVPSGPKSFAFLFNF